MDAPLPPHPLTRPPGRGTEPKGMKMNEFKIAFAWIFAAMGVITAVLVAVGMYHLMCAAGVKWEAAAWIGGMCGLAWAIGCGIGSGYIGSS